MWATIKLVVFGGLIMASIGYILPDKLSLIGVMLVGSFVGGAIYISVMNWEPQQHVKLLPLLLTIILTCAWASLSLVGVCNILSGLLSCSTNKIRALTFLNFFFPLLIAIGLWVQQLFTRK